jgi:hypothetical protein
VSVAANKPYTEADAEIHLRRIFGEVDGLVERWTDGWLTSSIEPGSSLAGDDARTAPYQLSHAVTHLVSVAVEQLHALKTLMLTAGTMHNHAPFTLARSAIEVSATGMWMLSPPSRATRVRRCMTHAAQDAKDGTTMAEEAGVPIPTELSRRLAEMEALAAQASGKPVRLPYLKMTKVVEEVDGLGLSAMGVLDAWRVGSGFAHGRPWASLGLLEREVFPSREPGVSILQLTNRPQTVLWITTAAYDLIRQILRLFEERARSPHRS